MTRRAGLTSVPALLPGNGPRGRRRGGPPRLESGAGPPAREYDTLGELYGYWPAEVKPADVLREKACEMGADAVIVTRDFLISAMTGPDRKQIAGTAIKYR